MKHAKLASRQTETRRTGTASKCNAPNWHASNWRAPKWNAPNWDDTVTFQNIAACKLLFFVKNKGQWNAKSGPKVGDGKVAMWKKFTGRLVSKWERTGRNWSNCAHTHTHTRVSYSSIDGPQHFERSASRIIEVRSIARQADHRVIGLTDWEWDGLFYHFKRTRGVSLLFLIRSQMYVLFT